MRLENTRVYADALDGLLFDQPVSIRLRPATDRDGLFSHYAHVTGSTPAERWTTALNLPFADRFKGEFAWNAMAMIPFRRDEGTAALHVLARSDLVGVESTLPEPLAKSAAETAELEMDLSFPEEGTIELLARLRDQISTALRMESVDDRWQISRGAVNAGSAASDTGSAMSYTQWRNGMS